MHNKAIETDVNSSTIERTVDKLRNRFVELVELIGSDGRLAQRLEALDPFWGTVKGYEIVRNARRGKAGEVSMIKLISAMEKLQSSMATSQSDEIPSVQSSLSRMGVYVPKYAKTQELQQKMKASKKS